MNLHHKITLVSVAALMALTPALSTVNTISPTVQAAKTPQKNTIKLVKKEYDGIQLYNAKGIIKNKTAYSWTSNKKSVFMLVRSGYKNQILNVKNYATEK